VLLSARKISKHFDGTQALCDVYLDVAAGTVHALVGENGAGKSTLAKIIASAIQPDSGDLLWEGAPFRPRDPMDAQRRGVGMIFQELDLFPHLTVADNLTIGNLQAERSWTLDQRAAKQFCRPLLDEVGLHVRPDVLLGDLSIAQTQLVAIARALGMDARLLILDEPTSALDDEHSERLFGLIGRLKQKGVAMLYVSHKMDEIFRIADRITVLRDGRHIETTATPETNIARVIAGMVGRELDTAQSKASASGDVLLEVRNLSSRKLRNVSFELRAGEVLGIAGLVGSGRSSLGLGLFGMDPTARGEIRICGKDYTPRSPAHAIASGIGFLPEDRKTQGLMPQMTVEENASMSVLDRLQSFGFVRRAEERQQTAEVTGRLRVKAASASAAITTLSGGNQQKVLLARWLLANPAVMILDDPTRGVDIGAKHDIYEVIRSLCGAGKGVILMSSELPELLHCSDRILVLHEGQVAGVLNRAEATQERIIELATRISDAGHLPG
jgi:ABC-type sugar transport system ATPase subunit